MSDVNQQKDTPVQTSIRLSAPLYQEFQTALERRSRKMTSVIRGLVEDWIRADTPGRPVDLMRSYLTWLPLSAAVKDIHGRIVYGNHEFLKLVNVKNDDVVGRLPHDYVKDAGSARLIAEFDRLVRDVKRSILCIEHLQLGDKRHDRMVIRFPIFSGNNLELTGVLGLGLQQMKLVTERLDPVPGGRRQDRFGTSPTEPPRCLGYCLSQFSDGCPA